MAADMRGVRARMRMARLGLAAASGALLCAAFPPLNLGEVVWLALLPLTGVLWSTGERRPGRRGFGLGWLAGAVFFWVNLSWLWTVSGLGAIVLGCYLALFWGAWGAWAATFGNPWRKGRAVPPGGWGRAARSLRFAFVNAALWVGLDWLRGWLFTGFGWNGLGVAFHQTPVMAQAADLFGVNGLAFLPVFVQCVVLQTGRRLYEEARGGGFRPHWEFGIAVAMVGAALFYGVFRLTSEARRPYHEVDVLMIQRNIPQDIKWDPLSADQIYGEYARATDEALAELEKDNEAAVSAAIEAGDGGARLKWPDLVVWPESALPEALWFHAEDGYPPEQLNADYVERAVLAERGFAFVVGVTEMELERNPEGKLVRKDDGLLFNSVALFPGSFEELSVYRKMHLVPFGEFIPFRRQIPLLDRVFRFSAGVDFGMNFDRGDSHEPLGVMIDGREVGIMPAVCFEDTIGRLMRKFVRPGPQLLLNATNDGWFKQSAEAEHHLANARFRCIELRRPMLRAANTGVSCLLDTTGSMADPEDRSRTRAILDEDGRPFVEGALFGTLRVPEQPVTSLYALLGDIPVILLGVLGLVVGVIGGRAGSRADPESRIIDRDSSG